MNTANLQIAIDGPVASGKGDIAARLAAKLGLLYIYTGAMYRALALACIREQISCKDEDKVVQQLTTHAISMRVPDAHSPYAYCVLLNGEDVTERITHQDTAQGASDVGSIAAVRTRMVAMQRSIAQNNRVVMEGRDIGLRVLPDAQLKIYLTASVEERARRRYNDWVKKGIQKTYEETLEDTRIRDLQDMTRATDPLQKVDDAWELDTTQMTQEMVTSTIENELQRRGLL